MQAKTLASGVVACIRSAHNPQLLQPKIFPNFTNSPQTIAAMKKIYLLAFSFLFVISGFAQNNPFKMDKEKMRVEQIPGKDNQPQTKPIVKPLPEIPIPDRDVNYVSIIDIGTSANAYTYWQKLSSLWVDSELSTVTNIHRMGGALDPGGYSGDLGYDISKDGGQTWENMIEVFIAEPDDGAPRYPNHGIYNPPGYEGPDDAYVTYFATSYVDENTGWGYLHGVGSIGDTSYHTANVLPSDESFHQYIPKAFDMTSDGKVFVVDANQDWTSGSLDYLDSLVITKGTWDAGLEDFTYTRELLEALMTPDAGRPADLKIAFGPDGQTGYIVAIGNNGEAEDINGFVGYYPIYWKTTDGGETWSDAGFVQLDGPNGLPQIVYNHLTDEQIANLFGSPIPARDEISYTTAFDCDIAVDALDNLHIAVVIGPTGSDPYSIITAEGYLGAVDIFTKNGGESWEKEEMGRPRTFRGTFGDLTSDNRIQITINQQADIIFISWLDTDLEDETDNQRPNIWIRGFEPSPCRKTVGSPVADGPTNVTLFSEGMWKAYFGTAPKYCFEFLDGDYTIPFVYVDMTDPNDPASQVQFKYIQDFHFTYFDDFWSCYVDVEEQSAHQQALQVSGNIPNPFREETNIQIELYKSENVKVTVYSITGQHLFEKDFGRLDQGSHKLRLKLSGLSSGIYFYTVAAGQNRVAKKMVVE